MLNGLKLCQTVQHRIIDIFCPMLYYNKRYVFRIAQLKAVDSSAVYLFLQGYDFMFKLLIVDDEYIVRTGIRKTVDWESLGIEIVGEASDGVRGMEIALEKKPDVIMTDVRMQAMGGLDLLKRIKESGLDCEVIIISGYEEFEYVREALRCGAFSYLVKPVDNNELVETVLSATKKLEERRHTQKYFEKLSGELSSVKRQFLREMLFGTIVSEKAIAENLEFYKIDLDPVASLAVYFKINSFSAYNEESVPAGKKDFSELLRDIVVEHGFNSVKSKAVFLELNQEEFAAIINTPENYSAGNLRAVFRECARQFEKATGMTLSVGIGDNVRKISQISTSFQNAKKCLHSGNTLKGSSSVIAFDDINNLGYKREIQDAIRYICENYANQITIDMVANDLYISASYLMHIFKDEMGKTFNECLTEYRIITAKELLGLNKYKIYEVSSMVGYKDVKYFSQIFKKYCGVTPREYCKKIKI